MKWRCHLRFTIIVYYCYYLVSRVNNPYGPQTMIRPKLDNSPCKARRSTDLKSQTNDGLEERLHNMEEHLCLGEGKVNRRASVSGGR